MNLKASLKKIDPVYYLIFIYFLWVITLKNRDDGGFTDFNVFFNAGRRLMLGENIYGHPNLFGLKYFYSPLFALLMASLKGLGLYGAKSLWFALTTILLVRNLVLLKSMVPMENKPKLLVFFIILFLMSKIVIVNYMSHQLTVLILWTVLESYALLKKDKFWLSAALLCLGINFKILPIVMVPYFIIISSERLKYLIAGLVFLSLFTFIPAFFVGWDYNLFLISEWSKTLNPVSEIHVMQTYEYGFLDLSSMVTKFLSDEPVYKEPVLNIAAWSMRSLFLLTNLLRVLCLIGAIWMVNTIRKPIAGISEQFIILSAFLALAPLCFPHQREYSFFLYVPLWLSFLSISVKLKSKGGIITFAICALVSGLLTWYDFVGQDVVDVFNYYRIITFGMLCMYVAYVLYMLRFSKVNGKLQT